MSEPDIDVRVERALFLFVPRTTEGRAFVEKWLTHADRIGSAYALDHREGRTVIQQMIDDGMVVSRVRDPE
jgi:kynureninase